MAAPNNIGYILEVDETRPDLETPFTVRFKLRLINTIGQIRDIWVEGPSDAAGFYTTDLPVKE